MVGGTKEEEADGRGDPAHAAPAADRRVVRRCRRRPWRRRRSTSIWRRLTRTSSPSASSAASATAVWRPADAADAAPARRAGRRGGAGARRRAAHAARVAGALPVARADGDARRDVRERAGLLSPRSRSPPGASRSAGASTWRTPTSSPRRRPPPASTWTARSRLRASRGATTRSAWRAVLSASPAGPSLPALEHERRLYCGEPLHHRVAVAARRRGRAAERILTRSALSVSSSRAGIAPLRCHNGAGMDRALRYAYRRLGRRYPLTVVVLQFQLAPPRRARRARAPAALPADERSRLRRAARGGRAAGGARQRALDGARAADARAGRSVARTARATASARPTPGARSRSCRARSRGACARPDPARERPVRRVRGGALQLAVRRRAGRLRRDAADAVLRRAGALLRARVAAAAGALRRGAAPLRRLRTGTRRACRCAAGCSSGCRRSTC